LKAGRQSVARSVMMEAVFRLQKGLDLLAALPDTTSRQHKELELRVVLGRALLATRGYAAPVVGENYTRACEIAEELDPSDFLVSLLYGKAGFHLMRGEHKLALPLYDQIETIGQRTNNAAVRLLGQYLHGPPLFYRESSLRPAPYSRSVMGWTIPDIEPCMPH
jgi:hypothetical protein